MTTPQTWWVIRASMRRLEAPAAVLLLALLAVLLLVVALLSLRSPTSNVDHRFPLQDQVIPPTL
jgi:hypothetical protein